MKIRISTCPQRSWIPPETDGQASSGWHVKVTSKKIVISKDEEKRLIKELDKRKDFEAQRIRRYLGMSDLSRAKESPVAEIVRRILAYPYFKDLDTIRVPEIVPATVSFDLFDFPADHPARSKSDTYYIDEKNILRTHHGDVVLLY